MAGSFAMEFEVDRETGNGSLWAASEPRSVLSRIWCGLVIVGVAMVVCASVYFDARAAVGIASGAVLGASSFWFLQSSMLSLVGAGNARQPVGTVIMFVVRWFLVGTIGYGLAATGLVSGIAILIGLLAPGCAVLLEAVYQAAVALH